MAMLQQSSTTERQPSVLIVDDEPQLELFLLHPRQVLTRDRIMSRVWGYDYFSDDNIIEVYIRHLREKLHLRSRESPRAVAGG